VYTDDLALAHVLADTADAITMARFKALDLRIDSKPDLTPVTDADTTAERAMRSVLGRARPRDGVTGEEFGTAAGAAGRRWVVDPIDGTKNYVRGAPVWGTLIGLLVEDQPVVGLVSAPALNRRWWAGLGTGAFAGRQRSSATSIRVSGVRRLGDAFVSYSSLDAWEDLGRLPAVMGLLRSAWRTRGFGDFYSYVLLAEGAVDVATEPELSLWDCVALAAIVTEAGGKYTSLDGVPGPHGGNAVATNGLLHDEVLARLAANGPVALQPPPPR
jgi:histidinol-phosphatase